MKKKEILKLLFGLLVCLPLFACNNKTNMDGVPDGAVVISGDLTYDKVKEAMAPLMSKQESQKSTDADGWQTLKVDNGLKGIDAGFITRVEFTQSSKVNAKVTIPSELKECVKVYYENGTIHVEHTGSKNISNNSENIKLYVSGPTLEALTLSGASSAKITSLKQNEGLSLDCSGASNVSMGSFESKGRLYVDFSGACNLALGNLNAGDLTLDVSGASNTAFKSVMAKNVEIDLSGASKINLNGTATKVTADVSGCSKVILGGKAESAELDVSGMSKIDITGLQCSKISEDVSGMSKVVK